MQKPISLVLPLLLLHCLGLTAQIKLPRLIGDGMILQRDVPVHIWGWASPGEAVELEFGGRSYRAETAASGDWVIQLPAQKAGGPHRLNFRASNEITVGDVYFGEVWVCSGQSNMELTMERVKEKYPEVIQNSNNGLIRQFLVPDKYDFKREHADLDGGEWIAATPETVLGFSAVGYFFAREIYEHTGAPVGLINAALGGSPVEAWLSEEALKEFPSAYSELRRFKDDDLIRQIEADDQARIAAWNRELRSKDQGLNGDSLLWKNPDLDDRDWQEMEIPGFWADTPAGGVNGAVWFRKEVDVPASMTGKPALLWLGRIVDSDVAFINGRQVGTTGYQYPPRRYYFGPDVLKAGTNTIAVRVVNSAGRGGFVPDKPYYLATETDTLDIKGTWKYQVGAVMPPLESQTFIRWKPAGLYNRMIHPLLNYRIRGVIWYQGESNTENPGGYSQAFARMIEQWREDWGQGDFPFLYVQLANFMEAKPHPAESRWAELRNEQLRTLRVKNTGMAVAIDLGEWNDIHPLDKQSIGRRLALLARKKAYGERDLAAESPAPESVEARGNKIVITFEHAEEGLRATGDTAVKNLAVSGDGENFVWANSRLEKNKLTVWHDSIGKPLAVRYAWADNPGEVNFYSASGLPVVPFEIRVR